MDSLSFLDQNIEVDETGVCVESFIDNHIKMARYLSCNDCNDSIVKKRLL